MSVMVMLTQPPTLSGMGSEHQPWGSNIAVIGKVTVSVVSTNWPCITDSVVYHLMG